MTLPPGVSLGPGRKLAVSQRGYFAPPFTACMFAGLAQILERTGYRLPLTRDKADTPPENFVRSLQLAGDPTPQNGSTMKQSQEALRKLLPDAPVLFGTMTEDEMFAALANGASIRLIVDCSKLPRPLKKWVGYGYTGKHAVVVDGITAPAGPMLDYTDPMWRPAKDIRPVAVAWSAISPAVSRTADGIVVTLGYQDAAVPDPCAPIKDERDVLQVMLTEATARVSELEAQVAQLTADLATANRRIADKDAKFSEGLLL